MARRYVAVAEVARPHGVQGEVRLKVYNQDSVLLLQRPAVRLSFNDGTLREVSIQSCRDVSKAILMKFAGVDDRDAAEALRGAQLTVARDAFPPLDDGEFYACDLEGARALLPSGEEVGCVVGLEAYPTCDVLVVDRGGASPSTAKKRGALRLEIPLVEAYIASIDIERGVVELVTIDGLG